MLTYRLNHDTLLLLDVEHHVAVEGGWSRLVRSEPDQDNDSPVLLCLLDVLKVGLALVGNGDSGRLKIRVKVSTYPLHCHQLTMVGFFGLSLVFYLGSPPCSCSLAANYLRCLCAPARPCPAGIVMSYTDNGTPLGLGTARQSSPFSLKEGQC